ncbi:hypothetical protein O181_026551 [Austropuccinia psidii MF-1]|uniref:Uncharacterized protein n=1 Tax=Austropuccinia psidii MF-1 TaxID=1389203 RepID=A0A9Q3H0L8_9BASI|nr:hypothetical protein [Austropuccinia psidii MF-1]
MNVTKKQKKCTFEATKDSLDEVVDIIDLEVDHNDNEGPQAETAKALKKTIQNETPPSSPQNIQASQENEKLKHDTMG